MSQASCSRPYLAAACECLMSHVSQPPVCPQAPVPQAPVPLLSGYHLMPLAAQLAIRGRLLQLHGDATTAPWRLFGAWSTRQGPRSSMHNVFFGAELLFGLPIAPPAAQSAMRGRSLQLHGARGFPLPPARLAHSLSLGFPIAP